MKSMKIAVEDLRVYVVHQSLGYLGTESKINSLSMRSEGGDGEDGTLNLRNVPAGCTENARKNVRI